MATIHLICNAHLDPTWLWEWDEGAAACVSTFRAAADFCEEFDEFIFNHNEALLYKWIEEYEPQLFTRIKNLVAKGKWHIMGGWFLQPDCNMPCGESFVRQILTGKTYFREQFGVEPSTAVNFDSFGHTRGLVQIMKKSGYDSYIMCRPENKSFTNQNNFIWVGYDDSEITTHQSPEMYSSPMGKAHKKVMKWMDANGDKPIGMILWGVGNHGGGPSRLDIKNLKELAQKTEKWDLQNSTPEKYFMELERNTLEKHAGDLNPYNIGCYTSQIRIKQKHRLLENEIYMLEKMAAHASIHGSMEYPEKDIKDALLDLLTAEFHDILPGSSTELVEENSLRLLGHGLEIATRLKAKAFFRLAEGQCKADEGEIPVLLYNPHPYKIKGIFECEFQLADQNWEDEFNFPVVYRDGIRLPSQPEKEYSNMNLEWRKKVVFYAELNPSEMNRFNCRLIMMPKKPLPELKEYDGRIRFVTDELEVIINCSTGLVDKYCVNGNDYLCENSFLPLVMEDSDNSWGNGADGFRNVAGAFALMSKEEGAVFSGIPGKAPGSVRVIEDGEVRTVVEALFKYGNSSICQVYKLPKKGTEIQVHMRVFWNEKSKMLKLSIPTKLTDADYLGQVAYGSGRLPADGSEAVAQKWVCAASVKDRHAITCINNGVYGSDFSGGEIRCSLLRSPGYSAYPIGDRPIMAEDRFSPRVDQGERLFNFRLNAGELKERMEHIDREALSHNEKPYILSFFPSGTGEKPLPLVIAEDDAIQMTTFKKAENSDDYIIRLFEPTGCERSSIIRFPWLGIAREIRFGRFEIKTFRLDIHEKELVECDLMEMPLK